MFCLDKEFARVAIQGDVKIIIPTMYHPVLWKFPRVWQNLLSELLLTQLCILCNIFGQLIFSDMGMPSMIYIWMFCLDKEFARVAN
jgi:hypothetical protein